jgi:effector-binding domain-containing protein
MATAAARKKWKYDPHPSLRMVESVISSMKEKTGRSLEEWLRFVKKDGLSGEKERAAWLKKEHGLGTNYATWIAQRASGKAELNEDAEAYLRHAEDYVEKMYAGPKEHLRPIYDEILTYAKTLGRDVRICPCQTIVPVYRNHVIAQVKPTTQSRIDLGLALRDTKTPKRLIDTGGFAKKDRITHRIEITRSEEFDDQARQWMRKAYEMDENNGHSLKTFRHL